MQRSQWYYWRLEKALNLFKDMHLSLNLFIAMHDHGQSANVNQTPVPRATMPDAASPLLAQVEAAEYEFASIWRQAQVSGAEACMVRGDTPRHHYQLAVTGVQRKFELPYVFC